MNVYISSYNVEKRIAASIERLLMQPFSDFGLIIVDNGSHGIPAGSSGSGSEGISGGVSGGISGGVPGSFSDMANVLGGIGSIDGVITM